MKKMGKWSYIAGLIVTLFLTVFFRIRHVQIVRGAAPGERPAGAGLPLLLSFFFLILAFALLLWIYYKAYASIRDEQSPHSPGKAVGYALIPIFNIYWLFILIPGFGKEYDLYAQRQGKPAPSGRSWLYWVVAIALVMSMYITKRPMGPVLLLFFLPFAINKLVNSVNLLEDIEPGTMIEGETAAEDVVAEMETPPETATATEHDNS